MKIFISHVHEEYEIANRISKILDEVFGESVKVFLSENIELGVNWFDSIKNELVNADIIITLFSPYSVCRPWINIETGYGIMSGKVTIPIRVLGLTSINMPTIYGLQQSFDVLDRIGVENLFNQIANGTEAKRLLYPRDNALSLWLAQVDESQSICVKHGSINDVPTIWLMGSFDQLDEQQRNFNQSLVDMLITRIIEKSYRVVMGTSDMLNNTWNSIDVQIRKKLALSASSSNAIVVRNPIVILGSLRSRKGIRSTFYDSIGKVPDIGLIIGGSKSGRSYQEYKLAVKAHIPILPIPISAGVASDLEYKLTIDAKSEIDNIIKFYNNIDNISDNIIDIIDKQISHV